MTYFGAGRCLAGLTAMSTRHDAAASASRAQIEGLRSNAEKLIRVLSAVLADEALVEQPWNKVGKLVDSLYACMHLDSSDDVTSKDPREK
jgi:hypothetical protein